MTTVSRFAEHWCLQYLIPSLKILMGVIHLGNIDMRLLSKYSLLYFSSTGLIKTLALF